MTTDAPNDPPPGSLRYVSDQPQPDAYETVARRFTWRSSLLLALVVWIVLMIALSEWMVARNNRNTQDDGSGPDGSPPTQDAGAGASQRPASPTPP